MMAKKMIYIALILIITTFAFTAFAIVLNNDRKKTVKNNKREKNQMLRYTIEKSFARQKDSKKCPLLRPERFRRLIKMRWGIDINEYPEDASIWFGDNFKLLLKDQSISGYPKFNEDAPFYITEPFPENIYVAFEKYFFFYDEEAYTTLRDYVANLSKDYVFGGGIEEDVVYTAVDMLLITYNTSLSVPLPLIEYVDSMRGTMDHNLNISWKFYYWARGYQEYAGSNDEDAFRISEIRSNQIYLYIRDQKLKGRILDIDYFYNSDVGEMPYYNTLDPWHTDTRARSRAALLTFLLQLKHPSQRSYVIRYMSGKAGYIDEYEKQEIEVRKNIRKNNYYGYAILREFCENLEREMPTLEKIGTSFDAVITDSRQLLYLEPYSDSYSIDTIQSAEPFTAYEMGYDDYYFVEIEKPVESPIAGPDGYAMILDRKEKVYGYLKKSDVKAISESERDALKRKQERVILQQPGRKVGIIDDPDGYVNIRKSMSVESDIISRIERKHSFFYWEIPDRNWWFVQKSDGVKGFVHKSRIREKINQENWLVE